MLTTNPMQRIRELAKKWRVAGHRGDFGRAVIYCADQLEALTDSEDWVCVPREPTSRMVEAGHIRKHEHAYVESIQDGYNMFRRQWERAIIAAAGESNDR